MVALVRSMGGMPPELLDDPEWRELFLPVLRSDFELCATYRPRPRDPLQCPIYVLAGDADPATACAASVSAWSAESAIGGEIRYFAGGHFFVREQQKSVLDFVASSLRRLVKLDNGLRLLAA
jgi:medium-chain acyl-[acyl-carrier-protein] hydrolase